MNSPAFTYLTIAHVIDVALVVLLVATLGLVLVKTVDLYFAKRLYRTTPLLDTIRNQAAPGLTPAQQNQCFITLEEGVEKLERGLSLLAVIASTAPFLGLGGTVLHIIDALSHLSGAALDVSVISGPISTALFATLLGLASAVLASIAYNLFVRKLQTIEGQGTRIIQRSALAE